MKRLFRSSQPTTTTATNGQRPLKSMLIRPRLKLLLLCGALVLAIGMTARIAIAQNDSGIKQQEDQLIREYVLPSAPTKAPVYKPIPPSPSRQQSPAPSRRQFAPAPPPQRESVAPDPEPPPPARQAPPRRRRVQPVQEPVQERPSNSRSREVEPQDTATGTEALPTSQYVMEFNRSPVVGNRFRLRGIYSEARLGFTRPRAWKLKSVKALIRFQHSPALLANRSNLTVRVNDRSVGSIPLNRKQSQVGQAVFNIPPNLIQDYNDLSIVAQQQNTPECSDPGDATLWTEVLPDSKLLFEFQPQPIPLNFSRYPYPFFDDLSLDANRIVYLLPKLNESWLTSASRFQAALGRRADFRPIETRIVKDLDELESNERLVVIGTPADQAALKDLDLPFTISGNQLLDGSKTALPEDVGVLILTTTQDGSVPVLVVTGNGPVGVAKAAQFLVQPDTSKLGTGQAILVSELKEVPTPSARQWPRYLPDKNSFKISDLKTEDGKPFEDITVRGSGAPPIEIDFRALPDDQFTRGSSMNLVYSYGPQVNPRLSAVEVLLNDENIFIGGARLTSEKGETRKTLKVDLPANLLEPTSKIKVAFRLNPREPAQCGKVTDQQLTGTLHSDSSFNLHRENSVQLPNLELLQSGFPFAAPQDLSSTAMVVPDAPTETDLLTLLAFSERLGRLSQADSVKIDAYTTEALPPDIRKTHHLVGIGTQDKFPFPEVFESGGFRLSNAFSRQWSQASIQTLPDTEGVIKEIVSPDNRDRVLLALSAQTEAGLDRVRQVVSKDPWFFQLQKDTVLISSDQQDPASYDSDAYKLEFLERAPSTTRLENTTLLSKISRFLQENWVLLPASLVGIALLLYGISQLYLKRLADRKSH